MIFYKSSTGGNDFILVEESRPGIHDINASELSRIICDRHNGAGADGLIIYSRKKNKTSFSIYNRDGSRAELSGNGMSGLGALLFLNDEKVDELTLETDVGIRTIKKVRREGNIFRLNVEIGKPDFWNMRFFPFLEKDRLEYEACGVKFFPVSMGNPHVVILIKKNTNIFDYSQKGKELENASIFPERTNIEFVLVDNIKDGNCLADPQFFERGVGTTSTSSTGSAAIFAVLRRLGLVKDKLLIKTSGSNLLLSGKDSVFIENNTKIVYKGTFLKQ